jgi:hypothetical protein
VTRIVADQNDEDKEEEQPPKPKPTVTHAETTILDGAKPDPSSHEDLDWEYDD